MTSMLHDATAAVVIATPVDVRPALAASLLGVLVLIIAILTVGAT